MLPIKEIKAWIPENLARNSVVLEAGTANGDDTVWLCTYFNEGMVYGFEPQYELYSETHQKVQNQNNIVLKNAALAETDGEMEMYIADRFGANWGSNSLLPPKKHLELHPQITFNSKRKVETINLDSWSSKHGITHIDFMWLDMQGYEPTTLKASPTILKNTHYIWSEVCPIENYEGQILYPEYKKMMEENGFVVVMEHMPWVDGGDVLFKNLNYER